MRSIIQYPLPSVGTVLSSGEAMRLAISEAHKGAPFVSPNPLVGAVVVDAKGNFIAAGHHEIYGGPHAEVNALKNLPPEKLKDATVYVTLEPCAHEGKTPSCAKMMAKLPLKKVIFGLIDPNPLVAGQGAEILKQAGIETEVFSATHSREFNEIRQDLEEVCEAFLWNFREKKVFVTLKMASSLDGQVALRSGESQWITGPEAREYVHYLRACYDAILVGKGTVEFDNPSLNIRHPTIQKQNKVVIVDGEADLLGKYSSLKLSEAHQSVNVFWCVSEQAEEVVQTELAQIKNPPQIVYVKTKIDGSLDLENLLSQLYAHGIRSVMVEGGALTASSFVDARLVNRLYMFQAPIIMGAGGSRSWTENVRVPTMKEKIHVKNPRYLTFGDDFMISGIF